MSKFSKVLIAIAVIGIVWFLAVDSLYLYCMGRLDLFAPPFDEWVLALPWWEYSRDVAVSLMAGLLAPTIAVLLGLIIYMRRYNTLRGRLVRQAKPIERGYTLLYGDQRFATIPEMTEAFPGPEGLVIGEAYNVSETSYAKIPFDPNDRRTWGRGGKAKYLIDPLDRGSTHGLLFGASGLFKSMSAVTQICHWPWQAFILDPSLELAAMLEDVLTDQGKKVYILGIGQGSMNVLDWVDTSHPEAESWVKSAVDWIYDDGAAKQDASRFKSEEPEFWVQWGKSLTNCLLSHMLWAEDGRPKTAAELRKGISTPERQMVDLLTQIHATSKSKTAKEIAGGLMEMRADETFSGIYSNAFAGTSWLQIAAYADMVSGNGMKTTDILNDGMTLFIQIPLHTLRSTPGVARSIIGSLLNTIYMADPNKIDGRILGLIDEARRVGALRELSEALDTMRKHRLTLELMYQSEAQLEAVWGREGAQNWRENVTWMGYSQIQDYDLAKKLSDALGTFGAMDYSAGETGSIQMRGASQGKNRNAREVSRNLMLPTDIMQMRSDELIIRSPRNCRFPIRCVKPIYFRNKELASRINMSKFVATEEEEVDV